MGLRRGQVAAPPSPPLLRVSPADSPWSVLRAHGKRIFKMATNGDKKGESNGVILSYKGQFCRCFSFLTRSKRVLKRRVYLLYL